MNEFTEILYRYSLMGSDFVVFHQNGVIKWANRQFLELIGDTLLQVVGKHCCDFICDEYRPLMEKRILDGASFPDAIEIPVEMRYRRPDGRYFWAETRMTRIKLEMGTVSLVVGQDITERKKEQALIKEIMVNLLPPRLGRLFELIADGVSREAIIKTMDLDNATINRYILRIKKKVRMIGSEELSERISSIL